MKKINKLFLKFLIVFFVISNVQSINANSNIEEVNLFFTVGGDKVNQVPNTFLWSYNNFLINNHILPTKTKSDFTISFYKKNDLDTLILKKFVDHEDIIDGKYTFNVSDVTNNSYESNPNNLLTLEEGDYFVYLDFTIYENERPNLFRYMVSKQSSNTDLNSHLYRHEIKLLKDSDNNSSKLTQISLHSKNELGELITPQEATRINIKGSLIGLNTLINNEIHPIDVELQKELDENNDSIFTYLSDNFFVAINKTLESTDYSQSIIDLSSQMILNLTKDNPNNLNKRLKNPRFSFSGLFDDGSDHFITIRSSTLVNAYNRAMNSSIANKDNIIDLLKAEYTSYTGRASSEMNIEKYPYEYEGESLIKIQKNIVDVEFINNEYILYTDDYKTFSRPAKVTIINDDTDKTTVSIKGGKYLPIDSTYGNNDTIETLFEGKYDVNINLPEDYYIKSFTADSKDLLTNDLFIENNLDNNQKLLEFIVEIAKKLSLDVNDIYTGDITISGKTEPNTKVKITTENNDIYEVFSDENGNWIVELDIPAVTNEKFNVSIVDNQGNVANQQDIEVIKLFTDDIENELPLEDQNSQNISDEDSITSDKQVNTGIDNNSFYLFTVLLISSLLLIILNKKSVNTGQY